MLENCESEPGPTWDHPREATVYYDDDRINGVEFAYFTTIEKFLIGFNKGNSTTVQFDQVKSFIGFYGEHSSDRINRLGFLVQDVACSEHQDFRFATIIIVVIALAAVVLCTVAIIGLCKSTRRKVKVISRMEDRREAAKYSSTS